MRKRRGQAAKTGEQPIAIHSKLARPPLTVYGYVRRARLDDSKATFGAEGEPMQLIFRECAVGMALPVGHGGKPSAIAGADSVAEDERVEKHGWRQG